MTEKYSGCRLDVDRQRDQGQSEGLPALVEKNSPHATLARVERVSDARDRCVLIPLDRECLKLGGQNMIATRRNVRPAHRQRGHTCRKDYFFPLRGRRGQKKRLGVYVEILTVEQQAGEVLIVAGDLNQRPHR